MRVTTWMAMPFLFVSAVLGLTGVAGLLVGSTSTRDMALSVALFGAGVAVNVVGGGMVAWRWAWQRVVLRWAYPAGVLALGIAVDGVRVPVVAVVVVGVPVLALLVAQYVVERRRTAAESDEPLASSGYGC
ncbi:hypothetical protein [Saccharothrix variisporea]|uniref:Uncharacterized protein n=1 Tax=Saccharothrix variisporea TaxID=543527 RepID=A0A495XFD9_9PSEU|nr:hypothetical protein [Saccharothrix variisporea]RKT72732.1 hypothetical protein DFJ66_6056 [Saccharothrix variisporea]